MIIIFYICACLANFAMKYTVQCKNFNRLFAKRYKKNFIPQLFLRSLAPGLITLFHFLPSLEKKK